MTRITQQQPESYLWMAAVLLRGTIDAGNYKQFIFPLLLLKRLCDVSDEETVTALRDSGRDEDFALFPENHRSQVRAETHWREIRKVNRDVGQALRAIETANPSGETQVKPLPRPQPRRCRRRPRVGWKVPSNSKLHFPYCFALHPLVENALETPFTLHFMSAKPEPVYAPILKSASIRKFGLFTDEALEFSPGINVIIGRNGCGKSHLLKLLYTLVKECGETPGNSSVLESEKLENRLAKKLAGVFRPDNDRIGRLVQRGKGRGGAEVSATFSNEKKCGFKLSSQDKISGVKGDVGLLQEAAFLPSGEVLALFEGFIASYEKRELSFDETFYDICVALGASQLRGKQDGMLDLLVRPLEEEIRGKVSLEGGRFYVTGDDGSIEAHLVSEGWRKLAALAQLIINGTLTRNGFLFWDEPEAHLNPRMVAQLSETLLRLANQGIQIFVVSHDYLLTTRLSLASEYPDAIPEDQRCQVRFFGLARRGSDEKGVSVSSGGRLADLQDNPILAEYAALYDYEGTLFKKSQSPV